MEVDPTYLLAASRYPQRGLRPPKVTYTPAGCAATAQNAVGEYVATP